jgi:hypothetical protein
MYINIQRKYECNTNIDIDIRRISEITGPGWLNELGRWI